MDNLVLIHALLTTGMAKIVKSYKLQMPKCGIIDQAPSLFFVEFIP